VLHDEPMTAASKQVASHNNDNMRFRFLPFIKCNDAGPLKVCELAVKLATKAAGYGP